MRREFPENSFVFNKRLLAVFSLLQIIIYDL